jgi:hypothetical protein
MFNKLLDTIIRNDQKAFDKWFKELKVQNGGDSAKVTERIYKDGRYYIPREYLLGLSTSSLQHVLKRENYRLLKDSRRKEKKPLMAKKEQELKQELQILSKQYM